MSEADQGYEVICFYRPYGRYACFSNFFQHKSILFTFPAEFIDKDSMTFTCAEKALMACKAAFFGDDETYDKILNSNNPKEIKRLGRQVSHFSEDIWDEFREYFMYLILKQKFTQCEKMKNTLIATDNKLLAEASPTDLIWGIGISINDPKATDIEEWRGRNILGNALMRVREFLLHSKDFH